MDQIEQLLKRIEKLEKECEGLEFALRRIIEEQMAKTPRKRPKQSIPVTWKVTDELLAWVKSNYPDLDGENEAEGFKDYWLASGDPKLNWDMAFRTWCRNAANWNRSRSKWQGQSANARANQIADGNRERIRNFLGELDEE